MTGLSVLVVHPETRTAERVTHALRNAGHRALSVPDGERAIDRFIQDPFDVLVVEMVLPGRDGGTTVESIRWAPEGDRVAVILLGTRGTERRVLDRVGRRVGALASLSGGLAEGALISLLAGISTPPEAPTLVDPPAHRESHLDATSDRLALPSGAGRTHAGPQIRVVHGEAPDEDEEAYEDEEPPTEPEAFGDRHFTREDAELTGNWSRGDDPTAEMEGRQVEHYAALLGETADVLQGSLSVTPFPRLLYRLAEKRATGTLVLTHEGDARRTTSGEAPKKVVYFRNGVPVYVQSNLVQECLGQVLCRGGHITPAVRDESVRRMRRGEGRQGAVLIAMGATTPHELRRALEDQLRVKLFDLFAWTSGSFRFSNIAPPPRETVTLEMSLNEIVLKGVVHRVPPRRLLDLLSPKLDGYVVPDREAAARFLRVEMLPEARRVLLSLDGTRTLRQVLGTGERPGAAAQLLYALQCVEAIRFEAEPSPTPRLEDEPPEREPPADTDLVALSEELEALGELLRAGRYAEALGVRPGDRDGAERVELRLITRYSPIAESSSRGSRRLRTVAREVCARIEHAARALGRHPRRAETSVGPAPERPVTEAPMPETRARDGRPSRGSESASDARGTDEGTSFDISKSANATDDVGSGPRRQETRVERGSQPSVHDLPTRDEVSGARRRMPEPDAGGGDVLGPVDSDAATGPLPLTTGVQHRGPLPGSAPPPDGQDETSDSLAADEDDLPTSEDAAPIPAERRAPDSLELDERVDRMFEAEAHFRTGHRALLRGNPTQAFSAFGEAVALCPDEGEFLAHLGYARYQLAAGDREREAQALEELRRSTGLAPKLDIVHVLLARVLLDRGESAPARDSYERALAANPDCVEALDELRALAGR